MWVSADNERFWVKYHFKTDQGIETLTQQDADRIAGETATTTSVTVSRRGGAPAGGRTRPKRTRPASGQLAPGSSEAVRTLGW